MSEPSVIGQLVISGIGLLILGLLQNRFPHGLSLLNEQLDSIGSRTDLDDIEPAGWRVKLTYWSSYVWLVLGIGMIILAGFLVSSS